MVAMTTCTDVDDRTMIVKIEPMALCADVALDFDYWDKTVEKDGDMTMYFTPDQLRNLIDALITIYEEQIQRTDYEE